MTSGVTYFARDPLRSYFHEPPKNEIYFLNNFCTIRTLLCMSTTNEKLIRIDQPLPNFTQSMVKTDRHMLVNNLMVKLFRKYRFAKAVRRTKYMLIFVPAAYKEMFLTRFKPLLKNSLNCLKFTTYNHFLKNIKHQKANVVSEIATSHMSGHFGN